MFSWRKLFALTAISLLMIVGSSTAKENCKTHKVCEKSITLPRGEDYVSPLPDPMFGDGKYSDPFKDADPDPDNVSAIPM